jgi:hypothetical protein
VRGKTDLKFKNFSAKRQHASRHEVVKINRAVVQCAEDTLFFRDNLDWIPNLIKRNHDYWIDAMVELVSVGGKSAPAPSQRIIRKKLQT